jgi:hypothetical protein
MPAIYGARSRRWGITVPMPRCRPISPACGLGVRCLSRRCPHQSEHSVRGKSAFCFSEAGRTRPPQEQQDLQELLRSSADLAAIYQLAGRFRELIHQRGAERLDEWMRASGGLPWS